MASNSRPGIVLYTSSVAGSHEIEYNTDRARHILKSAKINYTEIDISLPENSKDKDYMKQNSKAEKTKAFKTPQAFKDGKYIADFESMEEANECSEIQQLFQ